ncbi:hypothetical protein [Psychromicrobium lacuslunae]|uniref:Uncharacterized protein n=1 Tax=Psychromicrobium lacuslunae TaxID=1618207 RepID=A0A0D4C2B7_9MICC|nr:hypothetical protein [Psychromicrobium lacuslunae]AJT42748.1 hypothetical protein UM93_00490 [Psychromicrobium lacuslunae]
MELTADVFRALCRSSPWKWRSLRFQVRWLPNDSAASTVNGWIRRPLALRIEALDGTVLQSTAGLNDSKDSLFTSGSRKPWLLPPHLVTPLYQADGLVRRRPEAQYGEPGFGLDQLSAARFAAWFDPVELAGNAPVPIEFPFANVTEPIELRFVDHEGREAVEAVLTANHSYQPRTVGAAILFPGRTAVRIDVETGICLASQSLDGATAGQGHWISVLAVDEYMLDDLFTQDSSLLTDVRQHIEWELPQAQ